MQVTELATQVGTFSRRIAKQITDRFLLAKVNVTLFLTQVVVDRRTQVLVGAQVAFGGHDRSMAEEKLYLFEIASRLAAELRTGAPEIVR